MSLRFVKCLSSSTHNCEFVLGTPDAGRRFYFAADRERSPSTGRRTRPARGPALSREAQERRGESLLGAINDLESLLPTGVLLHGPPALPGPPASPPPGRPPPAARPRGPPRGAGRAQAHPWARARLAPPHI